MLPKADEPRTPEEKEEMTIPGGSVSFHMTAKMTRPDNACTVRTVVRFFQNPGPALKGALLNSMQYLLYTKKWIITYGGQGCGRRTLTRISELTRIQGALGVGCGRDAGIALPEGVEEILFLRQMQEIMEQLMRVSTVGVFEDNERSIKLTESKHASRRTKHIDRKYRPVRDDSDVEKVRVACNAKDRKYLSTQTCSSIRE